MTGHRHWILFWLLMVLSITARNQEVSHLQSMEEGPLVVRAVYVDAEGVKWFGTSRGLLRYADMGWRYYTDEDVLPGRNVRALLFDGSKPESALWVATEGGVSRLLFDESGVLSSDQYSVADGLLDNGVTSVAQDTRGNTYFGTGKGISVLTGEKFDSLTYDDFFSSMYDAPVRRLYHFKDTLYVAQDGGIGRFISGVDGITGASRWGEEGGLYGIAPYSQDIRSILVKGEEIQYFGTEVGVQTHLGYGAKENWDLVSTDDGLVNNEVIAIREDGEGGLWFGTRGGVSHLSGENWTSYTTQEGLLNDTVYDIGFDPDGSVWFGTAAGACRLKAGVFEDFITAVPERVVPELEFSAGVRSPAGTIWLRYTLEKPGAVTARLYNATGILVARWEELPGLPGENRTELPVSRFRNGGSPEGIHVLQLIHRGVTVSRKIVF